MATVKEMLKQHRQEIVRRGRRAGRESMRKQAQEKREAAQREEDKRRVPQWFIAMVERPST